MKSICAGLLTATLAAGCSPFGEEKCTVTLYPLEDHHLTTGADFEGNQQFCSTIGFRQEQFVGLDVVPGNCSGAPTYHWSLPDGTTSLGDLDSGTLALQFSQGGEVCVYVENEGHETKELCNTLEVSRDDVWGRLTPAFLASAPPDRAVLLARGDEVFAGFGTTNSWHRLDTSTFEWEEKSGIENLVDFQAPAGFVAGDVMYIAGRNSILYSYDPGIDSWSPGGDIEVDEVLVDIPSLEDNATGPLFGIGVGAIGFLGLSSNNALLMYDSSSRVWSESAPHPSPTTAGGTPFALGNQLFVGSHVFDINLGTWSASAVDFNSQGPVAAVDGVAYYNVGASTQQFDGVSSSAFEPRSEKLCNEQRPIAQGAYRSASAAGMSFMISAAAPSDLRFYVPK